MAIRHKIILVFLLSAIVPFIIVGTLIYLDFQRLALNAGLPSAELGYQFLVAVILLLLFVLLIGSLMSQVIVKPISQLSETTARIREGDFSVRAPVSSKDEIGKLAADFNAMAHGLEEIEQAKTELTAMISHQLRTPSVAVKGLIALLFDYHAKGLTPKQKKLIQAAYDENEKIQALVDRILDIVQSSAADLQLDKSPVDLAERAGKALDSLAHQLNTHHQKASLRQPVKPIVVKANPDKIQIMIENLLTNASKYSPDNSKITISFGQDAKHGIIKIKDQGYGIAKKDQSKIFDMFTRLDNTNTTKVAGSGLGLYLVKKIVDSQGGDIKVDSTLHKGTTFTVSLPLE